MHKLWDNPQGLFACVLAPTRELALQISAQFEALGAGMGVRCAVIIGGGEDKVSQAIALAKRPHIIVATPGRLYEHIKSTKGFSLRSLKYLVRPLQSKIIQQNLPRSLVVTGFGRSRSPTRFGLWCIRGSSLESHAHRTYNISFLCHNDLKNFQAATGESDKSYSCRSIIEVSITAHFVK